MTRLGVLAALLCLIQLPGATAKVVAGVATLDSMVTELFVAKFAFSSGAHGVISVRATPVPCRSDGRAHLRSGAQGDFNVTAKYLAQRPNWLKYGPSVEFRSLQVAMYNEDAWAKCVRPLSHRSSLAFRRSGPPCVTA